MEAWEITIGVASSVIALAALLFSIYSFKAQQERAEKHAKGNAKPLLMVKSKKYIDSKSIEIANYGVGPAVIKKARFYRPKNSDATNNLVNLFDLPIIWETFTNLPAGRAIGPQDSIVLVAQSLEHLQNQGVSEGDGLRILEQWQEQKSGISVEIEYEDILGNVMPKHQETLS